MEPSSITLKQLFIIAPHFPPSSTPPSQRVRLIIKHSYQLGFYPHAYTVKPYYREEPKDEWMNELLGKDFTFTEVKCFDQRKTRKLGIGDLGLRMLPFLILKLIKDCKKKKVDFILYPVPPWYILIAAPIVKVVTNIPYAIDFIDPWVHEQEKIHVGFKHKASQWLARTLEKWVCKNASIIFSVSEGINNNLKKRHVSLQNKPMYAIPYGAEQADFLSYNVNSPKANNLISIRYIGAIWGDCYPVLDGLMPGFAALNKQKNIHVEFIGTSYAGEGLAQPQLAKWINDHNLQKFVTEQPLRVTYKKAVELTMSADILFLIGGMQPYYAASKLMGLIASQKPFVAFVHKHSFPATFLKEVNYPYIVTYSAEVKDLPIQQSTQLKDVFQNLIDNINNFKAISLDHPLVQQHTAKGMATSFLEKIALVINK